MTLHDISEHPPKEMVHPSAADIKGARFEASKKVTHMGVALDATLTVIKILAGVLGHSAAMVAEGLHSSSDLLSDFAVLIGLHMAKKEADEDHPYGHGKYEAIATLFLALALIGVAIGIVLDAAHRIHDGDLPTPGMMAFWVAIFSMVAKEIMFRYTRRVGEKYDAQIIMAAAWQHRADAVASGAALVGVTGAILGWPIMDPIAAIVVAGFIGKVGGEFTMQALRELTDSMEAIDEEVRNQISELMDSIPEVKSVHFLKARRLGGDILVDAHVVVREDISVSEGHQIADKVRNRLFSEVKSITEVMVHVDIIEDQGGVAMPILAERKELRERVEKILPDFSALERLHSQMPHYSLDGIALDMSFVPAKSSSLEEARKAAEALGKRLMQEYQDIHGTRVYIYLVTGKREA